MGEPVGDLAGLALSLLLLKRVDELDGGEEADTLAMMLNGTKVPRPLVCI